jgi:hypothetical protein
MGLNFGNIMPMGSRVFPKKLRLLNMGLRP